MAKIQDRQETDLMEVIARTLGFLCLDWAGMREEKLTTQAEFLYRFGFDQRVTAGILGTSEASLRELFRQKEKRKGKKGGNKDDGES